MLRTRLKVSSAIPGDHSVDSSARTDTRRCHTPSCRPDDVYAIRLQLSSASLRVFAFLSLVQP
jgi:hypothetical protein